MFYTALIKLKRQQLADIHLTNLYTVLTSSEQDDIGSSSNVYPLLKEKANYLRVQLINQDNESESWKLFITKNRMLNSGGDYGYGISLFGNDRIWEVYGEIDLNQIYFDGQYSGTSEPVLETIIAVTLIQH